MDSSHVSLKTGVGSTIAPRKRKILVEDLHHLLVVNWVASCLSFCMSASTAATYVFTDPNFTTTIISLGPRALNVEFQHFRLSCSFLYWHLIQCFYFADTTERGDRGWKEAQRQGEARVTLGITLLWVKKNPGRTQKRAVLGKKAQCEVRAELEIRILKVITFDDLTQRKEPVAVWFLNRWLWFCFGEGEGPYM